MQLEKNTQKNKAVWQMKLCHTALLNYFTAFYSAGTASAPLPKSTDINAVSIDAP